MGDHILRYVITLCRMQYISHAIYPFITPFFWITPITTISTITTTITMITTAFTTITTTITAITTVTTIIITAITITTITITAVIITTITITTIINTTIRYCTCRLFLHELYIIHPCQLAVEPDPLPDEKPNPLLDLKPDQQRQAKWNPHLPTLLEHVRAVRPSMSELWKWSHIQSIFPAHSKSRFSATSVAKSTATSLLAVMQDPQLPMMPVSPVPAESEPPQPACSQQSHIVQEGRVSLSEDWDKACRSCESETRSKACHQFILNPDSLLPANTHSAQPAFFQRVQIHCY